MKFSQLKSLITEIIRSILENSDKPEFSEKFWWMSPDGKLTRVPRYGHWNWGFLFLTTIKNLPKEEVEKDVINRLARYLQNLKNTENK